MGNVMEKMFRLDGQVAGDPKPPFTDMGAALAMARRKL